MTNAGVDDSELVATRPRDGDGAGVYVINDIPPLTTLGGRPLTAEREELIRRATALVPALRARQAQTNRERKLPDETIADLRESGMLELRKPAEFGGLGVDSQTYCDVMSEIARGCGSTAWTAGITNDMWFMAGSLMPAEGLKEFYASGQSATGPFYPRKGGKGKIVEGGYLMEGGEWPWASGSQIAGWVTPRVDIFDDEGNFVDVMVPLIPIDQVEILDEWHTIAMRGSASNVVKIGEMFIPDSHAGRLNRVLTGGHLPDMPPSQRMPYFTGIVFGLTPIAIGLARAALEYFLERTAGRPIATTTYTDGSAAVRTQLIAAEAAQRIDAADLLLRRGVAMLEKWAAESDYPSVAARAKVRADIGFAVKLAAEAVRAIYDAAGASAVAEDNPLARVAMDINALTLHAAFNPTTAMENYGATLTGQIPPAASMGGHMFL